MSTPSDRDADLVSDFARRRNIARSISEVENLDDIDKIEATAVQYQFRESALPLSSVDVEKFVRLLAETYGLELQPVSTGELINQYSASEIGSLTRVETASRLFRKDATKLITFEGGRVPIKTDLVPIKKVQVNRYGVHAHVEGTSSVAETVAQEIVELLWEASPQRKRFSEVRVDLLGTYYWTQTRVRLPSPPETLLSPPLREFLQDNVAGADGLGNRMRTNYSGEGSGKAAVVVALSALTIMVNTMDLQTGMQEANTIWINVPAKADVGRNIVSIASALPYETHLQMVKLLLEKLKV